MTRAPVSAEAVSPFSRQQTLRPPATFAGISFGVAIVGGGWGWYRGLTVIRASSKIGWFAEASLARLRQQSVFLFLSGEKAMLTNFTGGRAAIGFGRAGVLVALLCSWDQPSVQHGDKHIGGGKGRQRYLYS